MSEKVIVQSKFSQSVHRTATLGMIMLASAGLYLGYPVAAAFLAFVAGFAFCNWFSMAVAGDSA